MQTSELLSVCIASLCMRSVTVTVCVGCSGTDNIANDFN